MLAAFANGESTVRGAEELRFKETDRITAVISELEKFGVSFEEYKDGFKVTPGYGTVKEDELFKGYHDHRIIMMLIVMALAVNTNIEIDDDSAIDVSFPSFISDLEGLRKDR